ncbi:MAG: hypothetical protein HYY92_01315 [Parcubacteria group bacterium]|nr:hypothetical protein [Parcubacteria group bacterium]
MESYFLLGRLEALAMFAAIIAGATFLEFVLLPCAIALFSRESPIGIAGDIIEMESLGASRSPWKLVAVAFLIYLLGAAVILIYLLGAAVILISPASHFFH